MIMTFRQGAAVGFLAMAVWAARLDQLRASYKAELAQCQSGRAIDRANAERDVAKAEAGWARQRVDASKQQADREAARQPIIIRSTDTVREYAKTDSGRALCRGADRLRAVDALDAELAAPARTASGSVGAVPADAAASPVGR